MRHRVAQWFLLRLTRRLQGWLPGKPGLRGLVLAGVIGVVILGLALGSGLIEGDRLSPAGVHSAPSEMSRGHVSPLGSPLSAIDPSSINPSSIAPASLVVDGDRLWQGLTAVAGQERFTREERETTRHHLIANLQAAGWTTTEQPFTKRVNGRSYQGVNVIAKPAPVSPQHSAPPSPVYASDANAVSDKGMASRPSLIIGAHYDTVAGSPGADDNGTGIAALLELAQIFSPTQTGYRWPLQLLFFDLEESGLWGSEAFVAALDPAALQQVQGAVILEMLGYRCVVAGCQTYPPLPIAPPSPTGDFLAAIGDRRHPVLTDAFRRSAVTGVPLYTLTVPTLGALTPDLLRSDHVPFWQRGIGAVLITDTANFRNPHYHQASDRPATVDPDFFTAATQTVVHAVTALVQPVRYSSPVREQH